MNHLITGLLDPGLWLTGAAALIVFILAFQVPYSYQIHIGGAQDRPFLLSGLHASETAQGQPFRWTAEQADLFIPALTAGTWEIELETNGWQPERSPRLTVSTGDSRFRVKTHPQWETLSGSLNLSAGDQLITLRTSGFKPQDYGNTDYRTLGIRLRTVRLMPLGALPRFPPFDSYILPLTAAAMLFYTSVRQFTTRSGFGLAAAGALVLLLAVVIAKLRIYLNPDLVHALLLSGGLCALATTALPAWLKRAYRRAGIDAADSTLRVLVFMISMLVAVQLVGVFYPQLYIFDALFHWRRLGMVQAGNLFFVVNAREFAGLQAVYPPGFYVFLTPLALLVPDGLAFTKFMPLLFGALDGLILFWVARRVGLRDAAALLTSGLFLCIPLAFIVLGWGIYANLFAMTLVIVTVAAWLALDWRGHPAQAIALFALLNTLGFLSHVSMAPMLAIFWGVFFLLLFVGRKENRQQIFQAGAALVLAAFVAFVLYFSFYVDKTLADLTTLQARAPHVTTGFERVVGGGLGDTYLGLMPVHVTDPARWLPEALSYLVRETWAYFRTVPVLLALGTCVVLWRRESTRVLACFIAAGVATALVFFLVGLGVELYTRYMLFAAPFIALGAGYALGRLWEQGRLGRGLVIGGLALLLQQTLWFWFARVLS